jgi:hypothetical protein
MFKHKKLFDRKNGEIRVCNICNEEFHTMKPLFRCKHCTNEWNKQETKRKIAEGLIEPLEHKLPYPFDTTNGDAANRFRRIQKELSNCYTKEERREFYKKQLEEAEELGILLWIYDRRDEETKKEKRTQTRGMIKRNYPDTRGMTWDEYERGLGDDDVDS